VSPWTDKHIMDASAIISQMIENCPTEQRGDMLEMVSRNLQARSQYFTAKVIRRAAEVYGTNKSLDRSRKPDRS